MKVDRARFLELTLFLAAAGCAREPVEAPLPAPIETPNAGGNTTSLDASIGANAITPRGDAGPMTKRRIASGPSDDDGGSCSNAIGTLEPCGHVSPTCEGLADECESLADDFRPRVAEAIAQCMAHARNPCRSRPLGACMRRAIEATCTEPGTIDRCAKIVADCQAAHKPPRFTVELCAKVLSAVDPSGPAGWDQADEERLSPTSEVGCSLEYVLPYQPWGPSWK